MNLKQLQARREAILAAAKRNHAENVRVFGSVVRDEAGEESDVDFLVSFEPGASLLDLSGLTIELSKLLGRKVDVISDDGIHHRLRDRILAEARPL